MIEVKELRKIYQKQVVLDGISQTFSPGITYGLVGPNGCGKTTLMRCICGFALPTSGTVIVNGMRVGKDRDFAPSTGMIIETPGFLSHFSGQKNLSMLAAISGGADAQRVKDVMMLVGLDPGSPKPVGKYSLGMRQRLGIAQAIMENPDHLILDEPFNGLDQSGAREIHRLLQELKGQGKTIILASHNAEDIAQACDVVFRFQAGRIIPEEGKDVGAGN